MITIFFAYYQRTTGPTYPVKGSLSIDNKIVKYKLIRTWGENSGAKIEINSVSDLVGEISYRRYKSNDSWTTDSMQLVDNKLIYVLPQLEPAGKIMYSITLKSNNKSYQLTEKPNILRYKGEVPIYIVILHIIFIFSAMLFSTRTGFEAIFKGKRTKILTQITILCWVLGGFILGPIMQKYAFDAFWTGFPFGIDLTDNKTLVVIIFWLLALWRLKKNPENRLFPIIAALMMIIVFLIPHSLFGSELDFTKEF